MKYACGTEPRLADQIWVSLGPGQRALARVISLGMQEAVPHIDAEFYEWAKQQGILNDESVVIEWLDQNPLAHNDPNYAPVANYLILSSIDGEEFVRRGEVTSRI